MKYWELLGLGSEPKRDWKDHVNMYVYSNY